MLIFILTAASCGFLTFVIFRKIFYLRRFDRVEHDLRIAATAFESQQVMFITDRDNRILKVNRAFVASTGYSAEEVIGMQPNFLSADSHDIGRNFDMDEALTCNGTWQGEVWNRRKNGDLYPEWHSINIVKNPHGDITNYVVTMNDMSERKAAEKEILQLAYFDPLTKLPNRRLLTDRLGQALTASARSGLIGAVLFIDLDHFKTLNDSLGHEKGDLLLQQVGARLASCVRACDTVARFGGDEFVVLLEELSNEPEQAVTAATIVGNKILQALNQPYSLDGHEHISTCSIGATTFPCHIDSLDEILRQADVAMYRSKEDGRNTLRFFDQRMQALINARSAIVREMHQAILQKSFVLYYQAQVDEHREVVGFEVLLRWLHPQKGLILPGEFISIAEDTGLILPIGHWVLETACDQLANWAADPMLSQFSLSVNISARQFRQHDFVDSVLDIVARTGVNPKSLKLELTESLLIDDMDEAIAKMGQLRTRGIAFSLDDFGTGYSSLSYLKRLPLNQLKIDQSFVRDILTDPNDVVIARTIIALAKSLSLAVIAEGVETEAQLKILMGEGCTSFQGYLFGKPQPIDAIANRSAIRELI